MVYGYKPPYNYPYGKYVIIKKFKQVNKQTLKKAKLLVSNGKIAVDEGGNEYILSKNYPFFADIDFAIQTEMKRVYNTLFDGYDWLKDTAEGEESARYLVNQYYVTAIALRFFKKLSPIEATFEAAFLVKRVFRTRGIHFSLLDLKLTKKGFLDYILSNNCLNIYLAVKYLEQLGFSKNPVKNKNLVSKILNGMKLLEEDMQKRNLTKEEWEAREKTKRWISI